MNRKSARNFFLLLLLILAAALLQPFRFPSSSAQEAAAIQNEGVVNPIALHQALLDLSNPWTVMCVAAHPDDEDGTSLTVLRHKYGVHTVSLFSTYGEGGQNAVGPELYEELGVIRARETMAAAEIQGSEPYFLGLKDFGFSKSADEAFRVWGHDEALKRMVLKIRELRPDVIITNHDTTSGHGHHQATGRLLLEAFEATADAQRFPDQLKNGLQTWQVKRVFVRIRSNPQAEGSFVAIDPNEKDLVRGTSFAEQALQALQKHQSQGPWPKTVADMAARFRLSNDGKLPLTRYKLVLEARDSAPMPKAATTFTEGLTLPEAEATNLTLPKVNDQALTEIESEPGRVLGALVELRKSGKLNPAGATDAARFRLINSRLDQALAVLSNATLTIAPGEPALIPNTTTSFALNLGNAGSHQLGVRALTLTAWGQERPLEVVDQLPGGTETTRTIKIATPANAPMSVPSSRHLYDDRLFGERTAATALLDIDGAVFPLRTAAKIDVVPAVEIKSITPRPYVWTRATAIRPLSFTVELVNHQPEAFKGTLAISDNKHIFGTGTKISLDARDTRNVVLGSSVLAGDLSNERGPKSRTASHPGALTLSVRTEDTAAEITSESVKIAKADAAVASGLRVGYVQSFDQTIEHSLDALGVAATKLDPGDIQTADLKTYSTIIIDNRGYEAHPELVAANEKLLNFVQEGGTLLVFYHKDNEWNPNPNRNRPQLAPYPIILDDSRVTDEHAAVTFLLPTHPLLRFPNRITRADFDDWIQERGLYYPKEWDEHYAALFAMNDPGEKPLKSGLLAASYGKGKYIYTSMVWYRELREGIPGAYRMFANMISYGHR